MAHAKPRAPPSAPPAPQPRCPACPAAPAAATTYDLVLAGMLADPGTGSITIPGLATLGVGSLIPYWLDEPILLEAGETVKVIVTLDGVFTVPDSVTAPRFAQFFGFNLSGALEPEGASVSGEFLLFTDLFGTIPVLLLAGCGKCLSLITGNPDSTAWGFTGFAGTLVIGALDAPHEVSSASIS